MLKSVEKDYIGGGIYNIANLQSYIDFSSVIFPSTIKSAASQDSVESM